MASSSGVVLYTEPKMTGDGSLDPTYWEGLDAQSQGEVAASLPQPPKSEAEYQAQIMESGSSGAGAPVISGLGAGTPLETAASVVWTTDKPASTRLGWGTVAGTYPNTTSEDSTPVTDHSVPLTGLTPATTYYVLAFSRDADGNYASQEGSFTTAATTP